MHSAVKRRTDVVGSFPNDADIEHLVAAEQLEWAVAERPLPLRDPTAHLRQGKASVRRVTPSGRKGGELSKPS